MSGLALILSPFRWVWPRFERNVCDSVIYCGPFLIYWENG